MQDIRGGYLVPSPAEREWIRTLYDAEVRYVDDNLGQLFDVLKNLGIYHGSLIILTSDHGEEFWEHGGFEHGHSLYDELIRVPLIVKLPQSTSKQEITSAVTTASIMPTILDLCQIEYRGDFLSFPSLVPLWESNPGSYQEAPIVSTGLRYYENRESILFDGLKYIRFLMTNREELYDLANDPGEQNSVATALPGEVVRARKLLNEHNNRVKELRDLLGLPAEQQIELDQETIRRLKALGYIQ